MSPRPVFALLAALAVAAVLTACGGSGGEESTARSAAAGLPAHGGAQAGAGGGAQAGAEGGGEAGANAGALPTEGGTRVQGSEGAGAGQPPGADPKPKASHTANSLGSPAAQAKREARKRNAYERRRYGGPSAQSAPFAKYSGPSSEGQLHLAEFGSEAEAAQRAEAAAAVTVYLAAAGAERWGEACGYLSAEARAQLQAMPGGDDESCAEQLPAVIDFLRQPGQAEAVMAPQGIASLRIETGGRFGEGVGFVLFHGNDGGDYWLAMRREGGQWRLLSVIPQPFTG